MNELINWLVKEFAVLNPQYTGDQTLVGFILEAAVFAFGIFVIKEVFDSLINHR